MDCWPLVVTLTNNDKINIEFKKSKTVAELMTHICFLTGIDDSSYFGLFINEGIFSNDFWLDYTKTLEEQIGTVVTSPLELYMRIRFYIQNPQDIEDYNTKVFFTHSLWWLVNGNKSKMSAEEFDLLQAHFNHGLELIKEKSSLPAYNEISDLPPIVTLNSFLYRISQTKYYLDGSLTFEFKDKITGTVASARLSFLGIKFCRDFRLLFVIPWIKFDKISFKTNFVKMQVRGDRVRSIPPQSFSLEFPSVFLAKSFWRICMESHKFYCSQTSQRRLPVSDLIKFGYLAKELMVESLAVSYIQDSYNFELSGGIENKLPLYISEVNHDIKEKLPIGTVILFINEKCTLNLTLKDVKNVIKCHSITGSSLKLGILKDFLNIYRQKMSITCRSAKVIENFINLMNLTAEDQDFIDKILILLPKVIGDSLENKVQVSIDQLREDIKTGEYRRQYNSIPKFWPGETNEVASKQIYRHLNRYRDTLPYDHNLVPIKQGNGYINASFVEFSKNDVNLKFIASQGPMDHTAADFYHLIWEKKIDVIVMVTGLVERGVEKCYKYWPNPEESVTYGNYTVRTLTQKNCGVYMWSTLDVSCKEESMVVNHFWYTGWPDHGVPQDLCEFYGFVLFLADFLEVQCLTLSPIVHCSAGVGRTGVVISSLIILHLIRSRLPVVPVKIVEILRRSRGLIVQTLEQYYFVCRVALYMNDSFLEVNNI